MKIYTKKGDKGFTSLASGQKVKKDNCLVEDIGSLDEFNSSLGFLLAEKNISSADRQLLERAQNNCFFFGAVVAQANPKILQSMREGFTEKDTVNLEKRIDLLTAKLPPLKDFILPGGCELAARAHLARADCRKAERRLVGLNSEITDLAHEIRRYLNRLSDYLFTLARYSNSQAKLTDVIWRKGL